MKIYGFHFQITKLIILGLLLFSLVGCQQVTELTKITANSNSNSPVENTNASIANTNANASVGNTNASVGNGNTNAPVEQANTATDNKPANIEDLKSNTSDVSPKETPSSSPENKAEVSTSNSKKVISLGVLNGKAISKPQPDYPPEAKSARVSDTVVVQITVDESGNVISAGAISGHPSLRQAAVNAARQARFSPTLMSGKPVKVSGVITYNFVLQ